MCFTKIINEQMYSESFQVIYKIFEDNNNSMKLPEKDILKLKNIKDKHAFTLLPKKMAENTIQ